MSYYNNTYPYNQSPGQASPAPFKSSYAQGQISSPNPTNVAT